MLWGTTRTGKLAGNRRARDKEVDTGHVEAQHVVMFALMLLMVVHSTWLHRRVMKLEGKKAVHEKAELRDAGP